MIALILLYVLVALSVALTIAIGLGPFAFASAVLAFVLAIWMFYGLASGRALRRAARWNGERSSAAAGRARRHSVNR